MKELYRIAGCIVPTENSRGFCAPYYKKVGDDETVYYVTTIDGGVICNFYKENFNDKAYYLHYPIEEKYPTIGVGDKNYCVVLLRDADKKEHVLVGIDMADAYMKVVELSKQYLLDTEAFLWAEREKYVCFKDKINEQFLCDVLKRMLVGRNGDICLEKVDKNNRSSYWDKHILPMYGVSEREMLVCCYECDYAVQYLVVFLKDTMSLHIHRLGMDKQIVLSSKFCNATYIDKSDFKVMLEEKFRLRLHWGKV